MKLYELVLLIRSDITSANLDKIIKSYTKFLKDNESSVLKKEYWGNLNISYSIGKNRRAHYYYLVFETKKPTMLHKLREKMSLSQEIIRNRIYSIEEVPSSPSHVLKMQGANTKNAVDVTV